MDLFAFNYQILSKLEDDVFKKTPPTNKDESLILKKESWSEDDDVYLVFVRQKINELILFDNPVGHVDYGNSSNPPYLSFCVSKNGFEQIDIGLVYEVTSGTRSNNTIISLDEALSNLIEYLNDIVLDFDYTIKRIEICYAPVNKTNNSEREIKPCWIYILEYQMEEGNTVNQSIVMDAHTGKVIYDVPLS